MYRIRRFGVVRTATVVAIAYAIGFAILFVPIAVLGVAVAPGSGVGTSIAGVVLFGVVLLVIYPLIIWVFTAVACLVYNLAARWVGGIEIEVDRPQVWSPPAGQQAWAQPPPGYSAWTPPSGPGAPPGPGSPPAP